VDRHVQTGKLQRLIRSIASRCGEEVILTGVAAREEEKEEEIGREEEDGGRRM